MSLCGRTRRNGQPLDWSGLAKTAEKSSPLAFQWSIALRQLSRSTRPTMSSNLRKPSWAMMRRTSSATKVRKRTTYSALPWNRFRRSGSCVAMPTGQVPRWHFRMRMQPRRDQGRGAEAEPLRPEQGADHHVAAGPHLAVALHEDAVAQAVEDQRLLRLGQADFPRAAGMLDRRQRAGPRAAVVAADEHFVGVALGHARRHRAHAHLGHQLHRDHARPGWRTSGRRSTGPGLRWNRCRGAAAARSATRRASSAAAGRSRRSPCSRAAGRLRPAWPPGPS